MPEAIISLEGHIIDSLILPRVWDTIMDMGGSFDVEEFRVGKRKDEPSYARMSVQAETESRLADILQAIQQYGATLVEENEALLRPVERDGVFPHDFHSTSNQPTFVRHDGHWLEVEHIEMDCGIAVEDGRAHCLPVDEARKGQLIVCGHHGIRVQPLERAREREIFGFMQSQVSAEKPKKLLFREIARSMRATRAEGGDILFVANVGTRTARSLRPWKSSRMTRWEPIPGGLQSQKSAGVFRMGLAALSPEHRAVIVLRHLLEYTPGEIAELLDLPRGTVNSRLRRGLDELARSVER